MLHDILYSDLFAYGVSLAIIVALIFLLQRDRLTQKRISHLSTMGNLLSNRLGNLSNALHEDIVKIHQRLDALQLPVEAKVIDSPPATDDIVKSSMEVLQGTISTLSDALGNKHGLQLGITPEQKMAANARAVDSFRQFQADREASRTPETPPVMYEAGLAPSSEGVKELREKMEAFDEESAAQEGTEDGRTG